MTGSIGVSKPWALAPCLHGRHQWVKADRPPAAGKRTKRGQWWCTRCAKWRAELLAREPSA